MEWLTAMRPAPKGRGSGFQDPVPETERYVYGGSSTMEAQAVFLENLGSIPAHTTAHRRPLLNCSGTTHEGYTPSNTHTHKKVFKTNKKNP